MAEFAEISESCMHSERMNHHDHHQHHQHSFNLESTEFDCVAVDCSQSFAHNCGDQCTFQALNPFCSSNSLSVDEDDDLMKLPPLPELAASLQLHPAPEPEHSCGGEAPTCTAAAAPLDAGRTRGDN